MDTPLLVCRDKSSQQHNNSSPITYATAIDTNYTVNTYSELNFTNRTELVFSPRSSIMPPITSSLSTNTTVYVIFFLVGVSMLLPWNVFITASEFFTYQFKNSRYEDTFQNFFSFASCSANLAGLLYALVTQKKSLLYSRSLFWLSVIAGTFVLMIISIQIPLGSYLNFWISLSLLVIGSFACSVLSSDALALAAMMNSIYVQANLAGQSLAGLAVAIAQLGILYVGNTTSGLRTISDIAEKSEILKSQGLWYFSCALITSLAALLCFWYLPQHPLYSYSRFNSDDELDEMSEYSGQDMLSERWWLIQKLGKEQPEMILYMILDFLITLSVFPGLTSYVRSTHTSGFVATYFVSLGFIIFNIGDLLGRYIPTLSGMVIASPQGLGFLSYGRLALIPIFLFSNLDLGKNIKPAFPPWLAGDGLFFLTVGTLAVTNGYLGTILMMAAPINTPHVRDRGMMASVMSLTMAVGLILGSLISFPFRAIACACNPF